MKRVFKPVIGLVGVAIVLVTCLSFKTKKTEARPELVQVTIVSRHNVRSPLASYMASLKDLIGPDRKWPEWSVEGGHLSLRGSIIEYMSGEFFRDYLSSLGFEPDPTESYFGASPKQRTVETSRAWAAGFFQGNVVPINYKGPRCFDPKYLDSEYLPLINTWSCDGGAEFDFDAFRVEAKREMQEIALAKTRLASNLTYLEQRLGLQKSEFARKHGRTTFLRDYLDPDSYRIERYTKDNNEIAEPEFAEGCDFREANRGADAYILQYYETDDYTLKGSVALNGLKPADLVRIASVKDAYGEILFTAPIVSVNVSHDMLAMIKREMEAPGRKLTFLCTHDSTIAALLAALRAQHGELDQAIEKETPIGVKILIEKWKVDNRYYAKAKLVYPSLHQLRAASPADLMGAPVSKEISFEGLTRTETGMYLWDDLMTHIDKTLNLYDKTARGENPFEE